MPIRHSTMAISQKVYLGDSNNIDNRKWRPNPEMLVSKTMKGTVKIPTKIWGIRGKIVSVSKHNSDRQPEISIWPPKPEMITSLEL